MYLVNHQSKSNIAVCCGLKLFKGLVRRLVWGLKNGTYFHSCRSRDRVSNTSENLRVACCILLRRVDIKRKIHLRNHARCGHFSPNFKLHKGFLGVWPRIRLVPTVSIKQQSGMILSPSSSIHLLQSLQSLNLSNLYSYIYINSIHLDEDETLLSSFKWIHGWPYSIAFKFGTGEAARPNETKKIGQRFLYQFSLVQPAPQGHRIRRIPTGSSALSPWKNPSAFCAWQGPAKKIWCFGWLHFTSLSMALRLDGHCHQCRQRHSCLLYTFQKPHQNLHWSAPLMLSGLHSHSRSCPTKWQYKSFGELYHKRRTNAKAVFQQRGCS